MGARIVVLGGGVGGLSAAQELAERGFQVTVYERRPDFGGKARSIPGPNSATPGQSHCLANTVSAFSRVSISICRIR